MDNWLIFLLGLVLGVPLSIFANIATPWARTYLKNRSLSSRQRKALQIIYRYVRVKKFKEDKFELMETHMMTLQVSLYLLSILVVLSLFSPADWFPTAGTVLVLVIYSFFWLMNKSSTDAGNFDEFEKKTIDRLKKLGYTLESAEELRRQEKS